MDDRGDPSIDAAASRARRYLADRRRDQRILAAETIGSALAVLRRLDHVRYDDDLRETITQVRSTLSVAQSKIKERIDG